MARGHQDFGVGEGTVIPDPDNAEQSARQRKGLGNLYRGGNAVFLSAIEHGLIEFPYKIDENAAAAYAVNAQYSDYGALSVRLISGAVSGQGAGVGRQVGINFAGKMALETAFMLTANATIRFIVSMAARYNDALEHLYQIRMITDATGNLLSSEYLDSSGNWQTNATHGLVTWNQGFVNLKFCVNNATRGSPKFDYLKVNGVKTDMSETNARQVAITTNTIPNTLVHVKNEAPSAASKTLYVGMMLFTINEP